LNVGLIGAGRIGRIHAANLKMFVREANLLAVSDINSNAAERCAVDFSIPKVFTDHRYILDNRDVEAVLICSATETHARMIAEAAQAEKQIFCEKPIALDITIINRTLEEVRQAGVKLQVGFHRRFDGNFRHLHRLIEEQRLGIPKVLRISSRDPKPHPREYIEKSGGIFLDMTIHDFDLARYLIGSEVKQLFAMATVQADTYFAEMNDFDTTLVSLYFENGCFGTIDNTRRCEYGYDQRVEVLGARATAFVDNLTPHRVSLFSAEANQVPQPFFTFGDRYKEAYIEEMKAFAYCILHDEQPLVTGLDGKIPVVMAEAARKSQCEGRAVSIKEIEGVEQ